MSTFTRFITAGVYANTDNNAVDFFIVAFADGTDAVQATASRTARPRNLLSPTLTVSDNSPVGMSTIKALMDANLPDPPFPATVAIEVEGNSAATEGATGDTLVAVITPAQTGVTYQWKRGDVSAYVTTVVGIDSATLVAAAEGYYVVTVSKAGYLPASSDPFFVKDAGIQDLSGTASIESDADGTSLVGATLTASYTGGESIAWQWYKDDAPLAGENANTLDTTSHGAGVYKAAATLDAHRNAYSNEIGVKALPALAFVGSDFATGSGNFHIAPPSGTALAASAGGSRTVTYDDSTFANSGVSVKISGDISANGKVLQSTSELLPKDASHNAITFWFRGANRGTADRSFGLQLNNTGSSTSVNVAPVWVFGNLTDTNIAAGRISNADGASTAGDANNSFVGSVSSSDSRSAVYFRNSENVTGFQYAGGRTFDVAGWTKIICILPAGYVQSTGAENWFQIRMGGAAAGTPNVATVSFDMWIDEVNWEYVDEPSTWPSP
jgi:hypothetical protein